MNPQQGGDLAAQMVAALVSNWPLVAGLAVIAWKGFPWALRTNMPHELNKYFTNGGGEKIRAIIREENAVQTGRYREELNNRFSQHEAQEAQRFRDYVEDEVTGARRLGSRRRRHRVED